MNQEPKTVRAVVSVTDSILLKCSPREVTKITLDTVVRAVNAIIQQANAKGVQLDRVSLRSMPGSQPEDNMTALVANAPDVDKRLEFEPWQFAKLSTLAEETNLSTDTLIRILRQGQEIALPPFGVDQGASK